MISMDARQIGKIARGIRRAAPEAWVVLRTRLRGIGQVVADDAKQLVYDPNDRVASKIGVRTTATGNVRVYVTGDPGVAIENKGKGFITHPVFGHRDRWTNKNSRPAFLVPAFSAKQQWALEEMEKSYLDTFDRVWGEGG